MDIRRLALWEGRYATYMSNGSFSSVIEDQGEVALELSAKMPGGAIISPLSLPYFRGTGSGVFSDDNSSWWQQKQGLYQAGGAYFSFPDGQEEHVNSTGTYWMLRRYGIDDEYSALWKYSEMKSREIGNKYHIGRVDVVLPDNNVLYTAIRITNTGEEVLRGNPSWTSMLSSPLIETGSFMNTDAKYFSSYPLSRRESGINRLESGVVFEDLKKAPLAGGGNADVSVVPSPTGTYDYMIGKLSEESASSWITVINPQTQMIYLSFTPSIAAEDEYVFPNVAICQNYYGRMDAPWALFDGATPQINAVSIGFNSGPKGSDNFSLEPGESRNIYIGNAFESYENSRISLGFYSNTVTPKGFLLKRTKSYAFIKADTSFKILKRIAKPLFFRASGGDQK